MPATPGDRGRILITVLTLTNMHEGELVQTTAGTWITKPWNRCPNGHLLGPNQVLVGHVACLGHDGGGHTSWHCRTCDAVVYGPPPNTHCTALEGPAAVRISNRENQTDP